jgi:hypothetical protein
MPILKLKQKKFYSESAWKELVSRSTGTKFVKILTVITRKPCNLFTTLKSDGRKKMLKVNCPGPYYVGNTSVSAAGIRNRLPSKSKPSSLSPRSFFVTEDYPPGHAICESLCYVSGEVHDQMFRRLQGILKIMPHCNGPDRFLSQLWFLV